MTVSALRARALSTKSMVALLAASALFTTSACTTTGTDGNGSTVIGGLIGAATGYAGCRLASANDTEMAACIIGGAAIGAAIGNQLSKSAKEKRDVALAQAVESGESTTWTDPESSTSGTIEVLSGPTPNASGEGTCQSYKETYSGASEASTYSVCKDASGQIIID
ncbi:hypothetical protein [uncultured Hyphomonas sp.]|uniref:hypothetical protein n=1 Tax=uncultured Hyphomonas sp. TaxID=225298 RepID=UPI002AAB3BEE|nr:hypothetical protein [uncultured Hyphomonas sp.]